MNCFFSLIESPTAVCLCFFCIAVNERLLVYEVYVCVERLDPWRNRRQKSLEQRMAGSLGGWASSWLCIVILIHYYKETIFYPIWKLCEYVYKMWLLYQRKYKRTFITDCSRSGVSFWIFGKIIRDNSTFLWNSSLLFCKITLKWNDISKSNV